MVDGDEPSVYEIRIKERLGDGCQDWFEGMQPAVQVDGSTVLTGPVIDQAALFGLLNKITALGLTLLAVNCISDLPAREGEQNHV